jgi:enterochelin esterase family protein
MHALTHLLLLRSLLLTLFFLLQNYAMVSAQPAKPAAKPPVQDNDKKTDPDAQYVPGPDSEVQKGVPQGKLVKLRMEDCKTYPGMVRDWWIYVPAQYDPKVEACVMVFQDGGGCVDRKGGMRVINVMDNLIHKKEMPVTIGVFINPGDKPYKPGEPPRKRADGRPASPANRSVEYDTLSNTYATFLETEILPVVDKDYNITKDPAKRCICGSSSGAICAFTVAWERPDMFLKVVSFIGSYTNIRGGDKYPEIVKNAPNKPIRIYQQDGKNDITNQFGSWWEANQKMAAVWEAKGYDHIFVKGEGAHNGKHATMLMPDALRWIWRDVKN